MPALLHGHAQGWQGVEWVGFWIETGVSGGNGWRNERRQRLFGGIRHHRRRRRRNHRHRGGINRHCIDDRRLSGVRRIGIGRLVIGLRRFIGGQVFAAIGNGGLLRGRFILYILAGDAVGNLVSCRFRRCVRGRHGFVPSLPGVHLREAGGLIPGLGNHCGGRGGDGLTLGLTLGLSSSLEQ
ncbi:hypothetical protein D3C84_816000 [compost metagenome]